MSAKRRLSIMCAAAVCLTGMLALGAMPSPRSAATTPEATRARHSLLHIGCKHQSHGPAWHARHTVGIAYERKRLPDDAEADDGEPIAAEPPALPAMASDVKDRAITFGNQR